MDELFGRLNPRIFSISGKVRLTVLALHFLR